VLRRGWRAGVYQKEKLDRVLGSFYQKHVGTAQGMGDLLDTIREETGFDPGPLAQAWLRSLGVPAQ
jgi:hypothetical protein